MDLDPEASFERLYRIYGPPVMGYLLRRVDHAVADEVFAEVFAVCWRRADDVPSEPLPWLLGVARRALSTARRGEQRRIALHARLAESTDARVAEQGAGGVEGELGVALASLTEADRELLLLIAWDGLTPAQAAVVLSISAGTARVRLTRARRRLRAAMDHPAASKRPVGSSISMESPG